MRIEIDILGHSCDVVRHGSFLEIASVLLLLSVLNSRLSQIIANLTRESLVEREAEIGNLPRTQTEKDAALAKPRLGLRAWRVKKLMFCHL